jgi:hypothetical protein
MHDIREIDLSLSLSLSLSLFIHLVLIDPAQQRTESRAAPFRTWILDPSYTHIADAGPGISIKPVRSIRHLRERPGSAFPVPVLV